MFAAATNSDCTPGGVKDHHSRWPAPLKAPAYHGVIGQIVRRIDPQTEADPAAILLQTLIMFGNVVGRTPQFVVGADVHRLNLYGAVVAPTAKGRKGMSRSRAQQVWNSVDENWTRTSITSGLSSGEGLIWAVRDPISRRHPIREKGRVVDHEDVVEDAGVSDKRCLVIESEFASTLRVMGREGNTLSPVVRQAWDGHDLRTLTKSTVARSTGPHISIIAHITADELHRYLELTECANGFGNRFLWVLAQRSKELPHGGDPVKFENEVEQLERAVTTAKSCQTLRRDDAANRFWESIYSRLSMGRPGLLGAMTARAEAQVLRLSCLYALADETHVVSVAHLRAALEIWRYCYDSAAYLFGDRIGDAIADTILAELRRAWPESLTRTEISNVFHRNQAATSIDLALQTLLDLKLVKVEKDRTGEGRPVERWVYASVTNEINELNELTREAEEVSSFISSISSADPASGDRKKGSDEGAY